MAAELGGVQAYSIRSNEETKRSFREVDAHTWSQDGPIPSVQLLSKSAQSYLRYISILMKNGKVFRTRKGYIGVGPENVQEGDQVCILRGLFIPIILRSVVGGEGRFEVIGETWVHGIMDGEFMLTSPPEEMFVLQ